MVKLHTQNRLTVAVEIVVNSKNNNLYFKPRDSLTRNDEAHTLHHFYNWRGLQKVRKFLKCALIMACLGLLDEAGSPGIKTCKRVCAAYCDSIA